MAQSLVEFQRWNAMAQTIIIMGFKTVLLELGETQNFGPRIRRRISG